ncbi:MAG: hypothetical protein HS132_13765 [Planctomycetia bacterium]|nr:hypothetical protein [Planctomycetia bacterium]
MTQLPAEVWHSSGVRPGQPINGNESLCAFNTAYSGCHVSHSINYNVGLRFRKQASSLSHCDPGVTIVDAV